MEKPQSALDAVLALDRALTLAAVRGLDGEALRRFRDMLFHWSEIAKGEMERREGQTGKSALLTSY